MHVLVFCPAFFLLCCLTMEAETGKRRSFIRVKLRLFVLSGVITSVSSFSG